MQPVHFLFQKGYCLIMAHFPFWVSAKWKTVNTTSAANELQRTGTRCDCTPSRRQPSAPTLLLSVLRMLGREWDHSFFQAVNSKLQAGAALPITPYLFFLLSFLNIHGDGSRWEGCSWGVKSLGAILGIWWRQGAWYWEMQTLYPKPVIISEEQLISTYISCFNGFPVLGPQLEQMQMECLLASWPGVSSKQHLSSSL